MNGTGTVAAALALVLAAGCATGSSAGPVGTSAPPRDLPACDEVYTEGAEIKNDTFGLACVKDDVLISPRPVRLECANGDTLLFNDLAWGYFGQGMTLTPDDDPSKMPEEAVDDCLAPPG
ncbi:MAG TPA: hypothetical protein VFH36_10490 [Acidimicrobiales bacterium]|jgi:hypothetical protein|nr:hypothetical protein [Acidimicrobiales bacterium]